jgi:hypothetical protein
MSGAQFQASIDKMLGSIGRSFGRPYAVYRIATTSSGDFPGGWLRLAQSMFVLRNRVSGRSLEQNQTTERTLWYELAGDFTRFRLGDVFVASDGPYAPGQSYGAGATSVPGTNEIDAFAFAWHAPVQPPHGARLDRLVGIYRPELTPGEAADGSTRWNTTHDTDTPLILAAGTFSFGSPGGTASMVPCGFGGVDRPFRGGEFEPDRIGITEAFLAYGYLPPLPGYTPSEGDALITVDDTRYVIVSVYRQETGAVGSQCLLARLISQST